MEVTQFLKEKQKMFQKYSLLQFGKITMRASNGFQKVFYGSSNILLRLSTLYQFELYNES